MASVSATSVDDSFWEIFKQKLIEKGCVESATDFVRLVLAQRRISNVETFCYVVVSEREREREKVRERERERAREKKREIERKR